MPKQYTRNSKDTVNVLFCGIGGQGVLTASEILSDAALLEGYHVKKSEVHGMAQRGGSVESHVRFGRQVFSPLIPYGQADFLVSFFKEEHDRMTGFLTNKGIDLIKGLSIALDSVVDKRYVNIFILGLLSRYLILKEDNWIRAIERAVSSKYSEENKKIFIKARSDEYDLG